MPKVKTTKYDLEERTLHFAITCRKYISNVKKDISSIEYCKQLTRSSSSIGANYIEANESFSKKDFIFRIKISRKEARETIYWLKLINDQSDKNLELIDECTEIMKIFGAIIRNVSQ